MSVIKVEAPYHEGWIYLDTDDISAIRQGDYGGANIYLKGGRIIRAIDNEYITPIVRRFEGRMRRGE